MIKYQTTRGLKEGFSSKEAIIQGLGKDGGLFVPDKIPSLDIDLNDMKNFSYSEIAYEVMKVFFEDFTEEELKYCINNAYDSKFKGEDVVTLKGFDNVKFVELYHGETSAFKDVALSILPYLLTTSLKSKGEKKKVCILTATSGDTGKAALQGFADVEGTEICVFYPIDGVSDVQKKQMTTQLGENTHVAGIKGNFDDAQTGVKKIFADKSFSEYLFENDVILSSANSINIGRLVPQIVYYVYSYLKLNTDEAINIVVPTGNFGNILAAYYAMKLGVKVNKLICASNENNVLTDFLRSGEYSLDRDFFVTNSPSMDILISSNLERLIYHLSLDDGEYIKNNMKELADNGKYTVNDDIKKKLELFYGNFCNSKDVVNTIESVYNTKGYLMDTHTAVAYNVYSKYVEETGDDRSTLIASTASSYKFADSVSLALGIEKQYNAFDYIVKLNDKTNIDIPEGLKGLDSKKSIHNDIIDKEDMKDFIKKSLNIS